MWLLLVVWVAAFMSVAGCRLSHFIRADELNQAIARGDRAAVKLAISKGCDVNVPGMHGITPLMAAAKTGHADICRDLIRIGADVNGHNKSGSVMMFAISSLDEETLRVVLDAKPDLQWKNALGNTAESHATGIGNTNALKMLRQGRR